MTTRYLKLLIAFSAALLVVLAVPGIGWANGAPVRVVLSYLDGVSNWGPKKALGALEVVKAEGEITLTATGLTSLSGESYAVWLKNMQSGETLSCGRFDADANGDARYHNFLPSAVPDKGYNFAFITVEKGDASQTGGPSDRVSLAGAFPSPTPPAGAAPSQLPVTGDPIPAVAPRADLSGLLLAAIVALLIVTLVNTGLLIWRRKP